MNEPCCGPGYASPMEAMQAPREKVLYTIAIYTGTGIQKPDYLCTIDADPESATYSQVISRLEMPGIGDELHHMGWNACSSCHGDASMERRYLIVPGVRSTNLHIVDCATDPRNPKLHKVIDGAEIKAKTNLSAPHTVHCLGSEIIISMLGDAQGNAPGGYLHLNKDFEIVGRWEDTMGDIKFGYDFWYQPRHNVMVSSEWAAPNTFMPGFDLEEVGHLKYGRELHFWDFEKRQPKQSFYLGEDGLIPLEVRFHHDPDSSHGFVGAALSANIIHWWKDEAGEWQWEKVIDVENEPHPEWPIPVPRRNLGDLIVDGRPVPVPVQLAARRHPPVRHYRPAQSEADRSGVDGRPLGQGAEGQRRQGDGRSADDPAVARRQAALCDDVAVFHLGQPVLPRNPHQWRLHADDQLRHGRGRHGNRPGLRRRLRQGAERPVALSRDALSGRRLHERHLDMTTRTITLANRDNATYAVDAKRPLLDSLRDQGVDLPYGCRYGGCITCAAKLIEGEVSQTAQVALNNRQISDGYVILCVARPLSDCTFDIGVESHDKLYRNPFLDPLEPHELKADIATTKDL